MLSGKEKSSRYLASQWKNRSLACTSGIHSFMAPFSKAQSAKLAHPLRRYAIRRVEARPGRLACGCLLPRGGGGGGVNRPPSRYSLVRDPSSPAPPSTGPKKFGDEDAYLPIQEAYGFFSNRRKPRVGPLFNRDIRSDKEGMPFDVKDLESEQTLWALYSRWCSYFNVARSNVEKDYRFKIFKEKVRLIYELKGVDPKNLELNHLCDVSVDELCPPKFLFFLRDQ